MARRSENNSLEFSVSDMTHFARKFSGMPETGEALFGFAEATGEGRAKRAAQSAFESPLWKNVVAKDVKGLMVQFVVSRDITLKEIGQAMNHIYNSFPAAHIYYNHAFDDSMAEGIQLTVLGAGFPS